MPTLYNMGGKGRCVLRRIRLSPVLKPQIIYFERVNKMYEGAIIKETLTDELILDYLDIEKVEIWKTNESIKYWTMIFFNAKVNDFPERLSKALIDDWFADMKRENTKYIVFKDKVLKYEIGNIAEKEAVLKECRARGIPDKQFNWSE
jgi:hypothetical protein